MIQLRRPSRASRADHLDTVLERVTPIHLRFWHTRKSSAPKYIPSGRESSLCTVRGQSRGPGTDYPLEFIETRGRRPSPEVLVQS
jgi:hypothetical protein